MELRPDGEPEIEGVFAPMQRQSALEVGPYEQILKTAKGKSACSVGALHKEHPHSSVYSCIITDSKKETGLHCFGRLYFAIETRFICYIEGKACAGVPMKYLVFTKNRQRRNDKKEQTCYKRTGHNLRDALIPK